MTFVTGEIYEWSFVINGRNVPIQAVFTGRLFEINGVEFGRFENVTSKKPYLVSLEGYQNMQLTELEATQEWTPAVQEFIFGYKYKAE